VENLELEVKENKFYVLTVGQGKEKKVTLHNEMESPIIKVKDCLKNEIDPNDIELMTVEMKGEKFEIKSVPWSVIALGFVKKES
jgi:hypothetical protein